MQGDGEATEGLKLELNEFSAFVLSLSSGTHAAEAERFQQRTIARLQSCIGFDSAWWGVGAIGADRVLTFQSFLHELPATFLDDWTAIAHADRLAFRVFAHPGVAQLSEQPRAEEMQRFCQRHGFGSALSISLPDASSGLGMFLSLYRNSAAARFSEEERCLYQLLMPHVVVAWRESWKDEIFRQHVDREICYALVSDQGLLLDADPEFSRRLLAEWPDWTGTALTGQVQAVARTGKGYRGKYIEIYVKEANAAGATTLWCIPRSAAALTPREESIARQYAIGFSYKEIARHFDLTPATVRSYLRDCYIKLGVSNKYELGAAINVRRINLPQAPAA